MVRSNFDRGLQAVQDDLLELGKFTENVIVEAVAALRERDLDKAQAIVDRDAAVNEEWHRIEARCLALIATQQPMAGDLRALATGLYIVNELERICDYGKSIAKLNLRIGSETLLAPLVLIPQMAAEAASMLHQALRAYAEQDLELARRVPALDREVDELYDRVFRTLMEYVVSHPRHLNQISYLLSVAYHLERAADRVTNICERVVFMLTGEIVDLDPEEA